MASFFFRLMRVLVVLGIALGLASWLYHSRQRPQKQKKVRTPPGVRVIKAASGTQTMTVQAFGTVVPRKKVNIAAEVGGRIDYLFPGFREGSAVRADDLLIRIDQRSFILDEKAAGVKVSQARADIRRLEREIENYRSDVALARKNVVLAQKEWDRIKALEENQFASKTTVEKAEQHYLTARIQLQSAENRLALTPPMMAQMEAALGLAKNNLDKARLVLKKSEIRAGFDGYVLTKQAEIGEFVNPGQVLGVLYEKGALDVDVRIPMEQLQWIQDSLRQGKLPKAEVSIANMKAVESHIWLARVVRIKANVDETTRTLPITLEIETGASDNPSPVLALKPGTFVKCRIMGEIHDNTFRLPRYLLHENDTLFIVRDQKLEIRKVGILRKHEDEVYINAGLSQGDLIVSSPLPGAVDGMALTVKAEESLQ